MALVMPYNDQTGNSYSASYWLATQLSIDSGNNSIYAVFRGYKDQTSYNAGLQPIAGALKAYTIQGAAYAALAQQAPTGTTLFAVLANAAENYALAAVDASGTKFFASATRI